MVTEAGHQNPTRRAAGLDGLPGGRSDAAPAPAGKLMGRVNFPLGGSGALLVNPADAGARQLGETDAFLVAQDVMQRADGLIVALAGEPIGMTAASLLERYASQGEACLDELRGSWALLIVDPVQGSVLLATDRMGRQPLYFCRQGNQVLFSSSLRDTWKEASRAGLDAQALYHYIYFHMIPAPESVASGFRKLPAAGLVKLRTEGQSEGRYWIPGFQETYPASLPIAHDELKNQLRAAVTRCLPARAGSDAFAQGAMPTSRVGAFLSGGLDSSTVAGMLSEVQGGGDAYTIGFDAPGYDEMPFARLAARHFGIRLHEHYVTPDEVVRALPEIAAAPDEPFGNSSVLPAYFCARMAAADGIHVLLAGDGGDELFAGNERYASQRAFDFYEQLPGWLRRSLIEPMVNSLPAGLPLVSKGRSYLLQANMPLPQRLQYYSFLEQNNPQDVFSRAFLKKVNVGLPLQRLGEIYHALGGVSALNRMMFMDWQITLADNDLRKVNQACALAGVTVRYPMLDDELVEFSTRIPSAWKLPGRGSKERRLRHFYKQALRGWLPAQTIDKSKHGFGLPFGVWMKDHKPLQEMAYENIIQLQSRGIFRSRFLDKAIASHREGHAAYFGELIWVLTCLEIWLAANAPDYQCEGA